MTHEEKINYMRIAAGICGFGFKMEQMDLLLSLYELVIDKKGESDLRSIALVESQVNQRADKAKSDNTKDTIEK